jgi:hypothetical protein
MPPPNSLSEAFRATGRPVQALLNTLIVNFTCEPLTRLFPAWQSPGFTRCVAFGSPASRRVLQSNRVRPARQPLGVTRFSELRRTAPSSNPFNLNYLGAAVKPGSVRFHLPRPVPTPFGRQPYKLTPLARGVNPFTGSTSLGFSSGGPKINRSSPRVNWGEISTCNVAVEMSGVGYSRNVLLRSLFARVRADPQPERGRAEVEPDRSRSAGGLAPGATGPAFAS